MEKLETTVYGNGDPGLKMKVDRLEQARLSNKERWALFYGPWLAAFMVSVANAILKWIAE